MDMRYDPAECEDPGQHQEEILESMDAVTQGSKGLNFESSNAATVDSNSGFLSGYKRAHMAPFIYVWRVASAHIYWSMATVR